MTATVTRTVVEHPILFSGPMVRALRDGTKTQTRRVALHKRRPFASVAFDLPWIWAKLIGASDPHEQYSVRCPYGQPGDRLWVRETWACPRQLGGSYQREKLKFRADSDNPGYDYSSVVWQPSIFMPRWASRLSLEITRVRVERVQDISEADAAAEGVPDSRPIAIQHPLKSRRNIGWGTTPCTHREAYHELWDSLNAKRGYGWDVNPYAWALDLERVTP